MNNDYQSYKEYRSSNSGTPKKTNRNKPENKSKSKRTKTENKKPKPLNKYGDSNKNRNLNGRKSKAGSKPSNPKSAKVKKQISKELVKEIKEKKKIDRQQRKIERWHAIKNYKKTFLVACFVVFYIGISMGILYNNSNISQLQYKLNLLNKEISKEKNLLNELEAERETTYKSETIENFAKYRLNMVYPTKDQMVYIKVD